MKTPGIFIIEKEEDFKIKAIKQNIKLSKGKTKRLFLDVDGTLVAMQFNPHYVEHETDWNSVHRTDFCHWLNSIHALLDKECDIYVLTNYQYENEKTAKEKWLKENLKCKYKLILNKEGITKSLFVSGKNDILVDDTLRNLSEWYKVGGTFFAYQYVTCEKGRRDLLESIVEDK